MSKPSDQNLPVAFLVPLSAIVLLLVSCVPPKGEFNKHERSELDAIVARWKKTRNSMLVSSALYSVQHASGSQVEEEAKTLLGALGGYRDGDPSAMTALGGARAYKARWASLLDSQDPVGHHLAALMLGVIADPEYEQWLLERLQKTSSYSAAMALGLTGRREYVAALAQALEDPDTSCGAAYGLSYLDAREHAGAIAKLLRDDATALCAVYALVTLSGREYAGEIAAVLKREPGFDLERALIFALGELGGPEHVGLLAAWLEKLHRDEAAIALALLGANEHVDAIARLAQDDLGVTHKGAFIALGLLGAKQYIPQVAAFLDDDYRPNRRAAASALLLLDAKEYAARVVKCLDEDSNGHFPLSIWDFHTVVLGRAERILALGRERAREFRDAGS